MIITKYPYYNTYVLKLFLYWPAQLANPLAIRVAFVICFSVLYSMFPVLYFHFSVIFFLIILNRPIASILDGFICSRCPNNHIELLT